MRLADLNPSWVDAGGAGVTDAAGRAVAHRRGVGVAFDCPCGCAERVYLDLENPLDGGPPHDASAPHWRRDGEDLAALTLSPSIQRVGGCAWHGFVERGAIRAV